MNETQRRVLYWSPRLLCILFGLFLAVFALDVFSMKFTFWERIGALALHLTPTLIVLIGLALIWRHEWIGGILFPLLGIAYLVAGWGRMHWSAFALISAPLIVVGILFLINWRYRAALRPTAR
ncbi:MAG: hypothetical protein ACM3JJ_06485 [Hyphomicrobiales bacterium]